MAFKYETVEQKRIKNLIRECAIDMLYFYGKAPDSEKSPIKEALDTGKITKEEIVHVFDAKLDELYED